MQKKVYLTQNGLERFQTELEHLRTVKRIEIAERIHDLDEDDEEDGSPEYQLAKQDQAFLEGRIRELERLVNGAVMITPSGEKGTIGIGSTVVVKEPGRPRESFTIVGSAEANPGSGFISDESPFGKALLGHQVGDKVTVESPSGSWQVKVVEVH
ncbi:MAG: transcription elongation factor GreA [Chloroflexi bacterium]|nr:MAG: transcription elongation factor GreA [Chloroflexota bacterium]MBL1195133.1 transcription elongation factor GreA [Chloroflexota bacterium]NOH12418.1 transcription elongation factor GreA [Chloroflexota bacterium]